MTPSPAPSIAVRSLSLLAFACGLVFAALPDMAAAQDWGEPMPSTSTSSPRRDATGWSARLGIGFTSDPDAFLIGLELPYAFDPWVSAGPLLQIGTSDHNTIVAPTLNVTVKIPDLPGDDFDRLQPYGFLGMGFAYIEDDNRRNDNSSVGLLIDCGIGIEYQISDPVYIGSQMMFNFLPEETLDENFFYSWQVLGIRLAF